MKKPNYIYIYIYIYIYKVVKFATVRLPFQLLLHRGGRKAATLFPGFLHFTLDTYLIMLSDTRTRGMRDTIFTKLTVPSDPTNARRIP